MRFEHATFALTGRSVRIADPSCPFEVTLAWVFCAMHQAYVDHWNQTNGNQRHSVSQFEAFNRYMLCAVLGNSPTNFAATLSRIGQGMSLLELARDIEAGTVPIPPLARTGNQSYVWFSRRSACDYLAVPGYHRAMSVLEDISLMMSRQATSMFRTEEMVSFLKRVEPMLPQLTSFGTPGSLYARTLLEHLASWDRNTDRCLSLVP